MGKADFRNHAAEIRVRVVKGPDNLNSPAVIEAEAGKVFVGFEVGETVDQPVIAGTEPEHQAVFFAGRFDRQHHRRTFFPVFHHFAQQFRGILQIGKEQDDGVSGSLKHGVHGRAEVAKIPRVGNHFDMWVRSRDASQHFQCLVARGVVDKDVFVLIASQRFEDGADALIHLMHVGFFVKTGGDDANGLHDSCAGKERNNAGSAMNHHAFNSPAPSTGTRHFDPSFRRRRP